MVYRLAVFRHGIFLPTGDVQSVVFLISSASQQQQQQQQHSEGIFVIRHLNLICQLPRMLLLLLLLQLSGAPLSYTDSDH